MNKLYAGGPELRLRQEWILGVGGVRVLRAMGIDPAVWHANEGHAAFMMVERVRELIASGRRVRRRRAAGARPERVHHPHAGARGARRRSRPTSSRRAPGRSGRRWASTARRCFELGAHPALPGQFHMTVVRHAALGPGERRVAPPRPGLPQDLARPLARPALGGGADRARHQRRAPGHLDGELPSWRCWTSTWAATGVTGWTSRASGIRC